MIMNDIILVDDDQKFVTTFTNEAKAKNITVSPKNSLDGLKELLPKLAHKYAAVVLDIRCLLLNSQVKEDPSFIGAALKYLDSTVFGFPRFILTGDDREFESFKRFYPYEKMYLKKPDDQDKLLIELLICVQNAEPLRIKRENAIIFEAFDNNLLPKSKEATVIRILSQFREPNPANFKGILADVREIHEEVYKSINARNKTVVPNIHMNGNGSPKFSRHFYSHLEGNPDRNNSYNTTTQVFQDSTMIGHTKLVHNACSEFIHSTSKANYQISHYTVKALINSLMELIIWSKQY